MTEDELQAIEDAAIARDLPHRSDVRMLLFEVRRLRGLIKYAECASDDVWNGESMGAICPWCGEGRGKPHAPECDAFTPSGDVR